MNKKSGKMFNARYVAYLGVLVALVIALQMLSGFMKIGATTFCLVLVPIVLGGMILGIVAGAILGGVFGIVVLVDALIGLDPFTLYLLYEQPFFTVLLCILKGVAAGVVPALVYKLIAKKNRYVGAFVAAALAPICNTGVFAVGAFVILQPIMDFFAEIGSDISALNPAYIVFVLLIGVNFFVELAINLVLAPAVYTVNNVVEKTIKSKKKKTEAPSDAQNGANSEAVELSPEKQEDINDNLS
ncbi:MAG: ECF transporter S component [Clostridia bacterium]|nr:ECF transporter S component [Clostridia bacterium]